MIRILLFLLTVPVFVSAQNATGNSKDQLDKLMAEKIRTLKNGALLVRLQTKENAVEALRKAGNTQAADQIAQQQSVFNKELIAAFRHEFNFCPVYFFESSFSENLLAGHPEQVVFVNDSLVRNPQIQLRQQGFLTAEAGTLEPDTASYFEGQYYDYSGNGRKKSESQYGSSNMGLDAIRIMNEKFVQLKDPFPYYVRLYSSLPVERKLPKAVKKLNADLNRYYESVAK